VFGWIRGLAQQDRHPADFQLGAGADDEVGGAQLRNQRRAGLDLVRVLPRRRGAEHGRRVAAEFLRERPPFGLAGEYVERSGIVWPEQ